MKHIVKNSIVFLLCIINLGANAQILEDDLTGYITCKGAGVANVMVTNGFDCVLTDQEGRYTMVYDWIMPIKTEHLFRATPYKKDALVEVRVTDRFGNIYKEKIQLKQ